MTEWQVAFFGGMMGIIITALLKMVTILEQIRNELRKEK